MSPVIPASSAEGTFHSAEEFREVLDRAFALMSEDPEIGPKLRLADCPQAFEFPDYDLVVNIRAGLLEEPNLVWEWSEEVDWEPRVTLRMDSWVANRYFQGRENVAVAIARGRIVAAGDVRATLSLLPLIRPLFARYRAMIARDYPHLVV
jgi:hypothetical protein